MADNKNVLPEHGPRGEGVDPLTKGKTTYGREDVQALSRKERKRLNSEPQTSAHQKRADEAVANGERAGTSSTEREQARTSK